MNLNIKKIVILIGCVLVTGCLHEDTSLEDLSSAPKAASFSIETDEDNEVAFQLSVTDREDNVTEYFLEEPPSHGVIAGEYPNLSYKPISNYFGVDKFKYKVTDGSYDSNVATVSILINPVNDPPQISGSPSTEVQAYNEYLFLPEVSDIEDDELTFSINFLPDWATFSEANGKLSGIPTNSDVGNVQSIVISVSDGVDTVDLASFSLDVIPNPWVAKSPIPVASRGQAAATYNSKIYVFGGTAGSYNNVYAYDPSQDTWEAKASMPVGLYDLAAHTVGNKIYIVAGYGGGGFKNELLEYDPVSNSWITKTPKPTYRYVFSSTVLNGKIYVIGGHGTIDDGPWRSGVDWNYKNYVEIYDPLTDSWSNGSPAPVVMANNTGCVLNSKIYVLGSNTGSTTSAVYVYDPAVDEWTSSQNMTSARDGHGCVTLNNKIYVLGGRNNGSLSIVEAFDADTGVWSSVDPMNIARHWFAAESVNNKIYIIGGAQEVVGDGELTSVEEFDPSFVP